MLFRLLQFPFLTFIISIRFIFFTLFSYEFGQKFIFVVEIGLGFIFFVLFEMDGVVVVFIDVGFVEDDLFDGFCVFDVLLVM